jgi:3-methyl-2-oxobutanoate hydroxymethyltransferase
MYLSPLVRSCALVGKSTRPSQRVLGSLLIAHQQARRSSHSPMGTPPTNPRKKVTVGSLRAMHKRGEPITMLTAHDFPSAHVADAAGMDMILVGDSLAMVALGMEDTNEVTLEEMLLHCRSVARATKAAFTVSLSPRRPSHPLPIPPKHPSPKLPSL